MAAKTVKIGESEERNNENRNVAAKVIMANNGNHGVAWRKKIISESENGKKIIMKMKERK